MSEIDFVLTPKEPIKVDPDWFWLVWLRACGAYIHPGTYYGLPGSLSQQYNDNSMLIWGDAADYPISEYWKHSTYHIRFRELKDMPENTEIVLMIKLKAPLDQISNIDIYVGGDKELGPTEDPAEPSLPDIQGEKLTSIEFYNPLASTSPNYVDIIIQPLTGWPLALLYVHGYVLVLS